jgi:hypothetical protein
VPVNVICIGWILLAVDSEKRKSYQLLRGFVMQLLATQKRLREILGDFLDDAAF